MDSTLTEVLAALGRSRDKIDEILRSVDHSVARAPQLAEMMRSFWPSSPVYVCQLDDSDSSHLCVLDGSGIQRPEWDDLVSAALHQRGKGSTRKPGDLIKAPQALKIAGYSLLFQEIALCASPVQKRASFPNWILRPKAEEAGEPAAGRRWGFLAVAIPKNVSAETLAAARIWLSACGERLAARLQGKAQEDEVQVLQRELLEQSWLANTGELSSPLTHEFNNFLNIVLLHVALLEAEIPEKLRPELLELRRQGGSMTSLVKQFQQYRRRLLPVQRLVDINRVVLDTVRGLTGPQSGPPGEFLIELPPSSKIDSAGLAQAAAVRLNLILTPAPLPVLGSAADLKRLCTFLLTNAAAAARQVDGTIAIRTDAVENNAFLRVEDTGPPVPPEMLFQFFEPATLGRPGTNSLELAACEIIVRRLQGKIRCENRAEGGVVVSVGLPGAPRDTGTS
jgi:signal transduction histidine kinase